jgi:hypothetical protein
MFGVGVSHEGGKITCSFLGKKKKKNKVVLVARLPVLY